MAAILPAIFYTIITILIFIRIHDWMVRNGLPIPLVSRYIKSRVPKIPFSNDDNCQNIRNLQSESGPCKVLIGISQGNHDVLETGHVPALGLRRFSQEIIRSRQEKLESSIFSLQKINDVIISAFTGLITTMKEEIGESPEITVGIHDLLLKNIFDVTRRHVLGEEADHSSLEAKDFYNTSATICYFLYHLGRNKGTQTRVRDEVRAVISEIGDIANMSIEEFQEKMPILSAAIYETCRLAPSPRRLCNSPRFHSAGSGSEIDEHAIISSLEASSEHASLWGDDSANFRLERFLILSDYGPEIDLEAVEQLLVDERAGLAESYLDKLFAYQQFMIGSLLLLDAFEFTDTLDVRIESEDQQQSWLEVALTTSLIVSRAKY